MNRGDAPTARHAGGKKEHDARTGKGIFPRWPDVGPQRMKMPLARGTDAGRNLFMSPRLLHFAALAVLLASAAVTTPAAVWHVRPDGDDAADGRTWATALATVGRAATNAVAGDEVWIVAGTYTNTLTLKLGTGLFGGFAGNETNRSQADPAANPVILVADSRPAALLTVTSTTTNWPAPARLEGLTFSGGDGRRPRGVLANRVWLEVTRCEFVNIGSSVNVQSSALEFSGARLSVRHCVFRGNRGQTGAAIRSLSATQPVQIEGCLFEDNAATLCGGVSLAGGQPHLTGNVFRGNSAAVQFYGGAVQLENTAARLEGNLFVGNTAGAGAAVWVITPGFAPSGPLTELLNNVFATNVSTATSDRPEVRATVLVTRARVRVAHNTWADNRGSTNRGGALHLTGPSDALVTDNLFAGPGVLVGSTNATVTFARNGFFDPGGPAVLPDGALPVAGNVLLDPQFTPDGFRLQPGSPARDLGGPAGGVDFDGQPRWQGTSSDLGAVELPPAAAAHAALARLDWRVVTVGDLAYLRYAGVLSNSCAVSLAGTVSNGVVHVTPLVPPGSPPCDEPAVLNGLLPLGGWRPELAALPVALDGQVATGVVTPAPPGPLPPALRLLAGTPNLRVTVLGLPGLTYTLERTEDFVRWEPVAELHDTAPAGDPDEPVSLEHSLPPAGTNGVLRLRM